MQERVLDNAITRHRQGICNLLEKRNIKYDVKINGMRNRTLRVVVGDTLSSPMSIENGIVQGLVLSVTLFLLVAMATICRGTDKNPGYAAD
jgi:hypothetical protein